MDMPKNLESWLKAVSKHSVNGNVQFAADGGLLLMLDCWEAGGITVKVQENTVEVIAAKPSRKEDTKGLAGSNDPMSIED